MLWCFRRKKKHRHILYIMAVPLVPGFLKRSDFSKALPSKKPRVLRLASRPVAFGQKTQARVWNVTPLGSACNIVFFHFTSVLLYYLKWLAAVGHPSLMHEHITLTNLIVQIVKTLTILFCIYGYATAGATCNASVLYIEHSHDGHWSAHVYRGLR